MKLLQDNIDKIVLHQLKNYWLEIDEDVIIKAVPQALQALDNCFSGLPIKRFFDGNESLFSPYVSIHWMLFLYRLSHLLYQKGNTQAADQVYYLNKVMHANDWFYAIELPTHFLCEHPVGSVLGRADYGDYFFVYQGTTVGGNRTKGILSYPRIGSNVILFANATVLGDTTIGNNVIVSAETYLKNEQIPNNCIVFGRSPNITIKQKTELEIKEYTNHIWGWY